MWFLRLDRVLISRRLETQSWSLGLDLGLGCLSLDYILIACHSKSIYKVTGCKGRITQTEQKLTEWLLSELIKSNVAVKKLCSCLYLCTTNYPLLILGRESWSRSWSLTSVLSWSWRSKSRSWSWVLEVELSIDDEYRQNECHSNNVTLRYGGIINGKNVSWPRFFGPTR